MTNYSSLSAAPVFKGRAFHPGNQARRPPEFLVRLSIINLRRQCLQHPSVTSSRISLQRFKAQDHFVVPAQKFMKHSQCLAPSSTPPCRRSSPVGKNCCLSLCVIFGLHLLSKNFRRSEFIITLMISFM